MSDAQILVGTTATLQATFYADGVPTTDSPVTVTITRADGTAVVTAAATGSGGTGVYQYILAAQPNLNLLKAVWTGATQVMTTYAEIVGAHLFTIAALRAMSTSGGTPFSDPAKFPNDRLQDARSAVLDEFEQILGFSPVPRFAYEIHDGRGRCEILVDHRKAGPLVSVAVNGVVQPVGNYTIDRSGVLRATANYLPSGYFQYGAGNIAVGYVHGWTRIMGRGGNIAMIAAANQLQPGFGSTARSVTTADGTTYDLGDAAGQVTASGRVREYGIPVIDAWLSRWSEASPVVA